MKSDEKIAKALDVHLMQWEANGEAVRSQMAPAVERWSEIAKAVTQMASPVKIHESLMPGAPSLRKLTGALNDFELSGAPVFGS